MEQDNEDWGAGTSIATSRATTTNKFLFSPTRDMERENRLKEKIMLSKQDYLQINPSVLSNGPKLFTQFCKWEKVLNIKAASVSEKVKSGMNWNNLKKHMIGLNEIEDGYNQTRSTMMVVHNKEPQDLEDEDKDQYE